MPRVRREDSGARPSRGRPTLYRGIQMRSRLEADYAAHLDATVGPGRWEYEPDCFAGPGGQWLPDFRINGTDRRTYVELKPLDVLRGSPVDAIDKILEQMEIARLSEPECALLLQFWEWGKASGKAEIIHTPPYSLWLYHPGGGLPSGMWLGMMQLEKVYAQDVGAEQRLLQGMLLSVDVCKSTSTLVNADHYWRPAHRLIHQAITELISQGAPSDPVAVAEKLARRGELDRAGGARYLHELVGRELPKRRSYESDARTVAVWAESRHSSLTEHPLEDPALRHAWRRSKPIQPPSTSE